LPQIFLLQRCSFPGGGQVVDHRAGGICTGLGGLIAVVTRPGRTTFRLPDGYPSGVMGSQAYHEQLRVVNLEKTNEVSFAKQKRQGTLKGKAGKTKQELPSSLSIIIEIIYRR
jgi:hypothetical protein